MNRKLVGGAVAVVVVVAGVWLLWLRDRGDDAGKAATGGSARSGGIKLDVPKQSSDRAGPRGFGPKWSLDVDPEGPLRLEGQVVGLDGRGVGDAEVWLASVPPRSAKTEDDGTFVFDKLVGRTYSISAKSGDLVGGPMDFKLTEKSDPIVIRLGAGAAVMVSVVDDAAKPIGDAEVKLTGEGERAAKTDAQGKATLKPVHPGWVAVEATAAGYAPGSNFTTVGSPGAVGELKITLRKGAAVSGRVIDDKGAPIAKVRVTTSDGFWDGGSDALSATTDDKGHFAFAALAPGNHTLQAVDGEHAPSRSLPIAVTADRPVGDVEIVMKQGGVFAGVVVNRDGSPAPYATVRVAGSGQRMWMTASRQATADKTGKFELRGLVRAKLQGRAESDVAASKIVAVDLSTKTKVEDRLVLDVDGVISGVVVDDKGQPVAEIQVNAFPDILGGAPTEGLVLAGMTSTTSDGAGAFTVHGLPDGAYRLWAARSTTNRDWGQQGTPAKAGDKNVRIVLPATGTLVGKVVLAGSATPPKIVLVQVGTHTPTPSANGAVSVEELAPGAYDVTFRGAEFAELTKHDVKIEPSKTTDMGTITVNRGRRLTGKVVDASGAPVAGAKLKVGEMLFAVAGQEDRFDNFDDIAGIRASVSDADGEFTIIGIPTKATNVVADHPDRGRSLATAVPAGTDDPPAMTIALRGFGSIVGKVTMQGQPQPGVSISESAKGGSGAQATFAQTAEDGSFTLAKVQEGTHVLNAMRQQMMAMKSTSVTVNVVAGRQSTVTIDIPVGSVTLDVAVKAAPGATVNAAQVWLFTGVVQAANAKQLLDGLFQGGIQGMKIWLGPAFPPPEFDELVPGDYSACAVPVTGDVGDPKFQQRLQQNMQLLKVYCKVVRVAASPAKQTVTHEVPSMVPLPTPTQ